jgi:hypothetical protein
VKRHFLPTFFVLQKIDNHPPEVNSVPRRGEKACEARPDNIRDAANGISRNWSAARNRLEDGVGQIILQGRSYKNIRGAINMRKELVVTDVLDVSVGKLSEFRWCA